MFKKHQKKLIKTIVYVSVFGLVLYSSPINVFLNFTSSASADEGQSMCQVDVDVVLIMDRSGSMADGGAPSECEWLEYEPPYCVPYTEEDVTEQWCADQESAPPCHGYTYIPASQSKIDSAKNSANSFLNNMGPNDQSAIVSFSDNASLDKQLSTDHVASQFVINGLTTGGSTNIGDAIDGGVQELGSERANPQAVKVMILLTDGKANKPNGTGEIENADDVQYALDKAIEAAGDGYKIFTVGLGSNDDINEDMLQDIADATSAQYYHAPDGDGLSQIYDQIAWEICQYGSISGCKYNDLNGDGVIDLQEPTVNDWEVVLNNGIATTTQTVLDGCYTFAGLVDGEYTVSETVQEGWVQTYPPDGFHSVIISGHNDEVDKDFANYYPECGNDILDENEQCDDGNTDDGDGCSSQCEIEEPIEPSCGDGFINQPNEQCDDGNLIDGDGCSHLCLITTECHDGVDNDDDGFIDYPDDPGCDNQQDDNETDMTEEGVQPGDVVINEIIQDPDAVSDSKGEWFEVYNTANHSIDLENCVITDNDANFHIISSSLIVLSQDYAVLGVKDNIAQNGGVNVDYKYSSFGLSNTDDEIVLSCNGVEIDRVEYTGSPPWSDPTGASMILAHPSLDNNDGSNWCESTLPWTGSAGDFGSPGEANESCGGQGPLGLGSLMICKYEDFDGDIETCYDKIPVNGWVFDISMNSYITTATTTDDGCVLVEGLEPTDQYQYVIDERIPDGWAYLWPGHNTTTDLMAGEIKEINFYNYRYSSISGYKYEDLDNNTTTEEYIDHPVPDWAIYLYDSEMTLIDETTTDQSGYYEFTELAPGDYLLSEELPANWTQLSAPEDPITLTSGTDSINNDFINYYEEPEPEPGPVEPAGTGPSGGGGLPPGLTIFNEAEATLRQTTITITWQTNYFSTSQIIYSAEGEPHTLDPSAPPYYGYAHATPEPENPDLVTFHSVTLTGLDPDTTYYYRCVSHASPPSFSYLEYSFTTAEAEGVGTEQGSVQEEEQLTPPEEEAPPVVGPLIPVVEAGEVAGEEAEEEDVGTEQGSVREQEPTKECSLLCGWREWLVIVLLLILLSASYHLVLRDNGVKLTKNDQLNK